jgi:hypothetical protein
MDNALLYMMGTCFVLVGVLTGAFFTYRIFQGFTSARWPFVVGELESTDLKEVIYKGRDSRGGADEASAWVVDFRYSYSVSGKKYDGSRVTYSDGINKTARALKRLQGKYKGKSQIQVFFNPKNPDQSVLVPGLSIFNFTPLITSSLFVAAGVFMYVYDF